MSRRGVLGPRSLGLRLVRAIHDGGVNLSDMDDGLDDELNVRDFAHEAAHALSIGIPHGSWDRESIHEAVMELSDKAAVQNEVVARAVERIVCRRLRAPCFTPEKQAVIATWEAREHSYRAYGPEKRKLEALADMPDNVFMLRVREAAARRSTIRLTKQVLGLAGISL